LIAAATFSLLHVVEYLLVFDPADMLFYNFCMKIPNITTRDSIADRAVGITLVIVALAEFVIYLVIFKAREKGGSETIIAFSA
jgi:riboflavin transporter FmnP